MRGVVTEEQGRQNIYAVEPQMYVDSEVRTGFTEYAEKLNGRLAMIGFVSMLLLEVITHQGLVGLLQSL
ncbi:MAG: chlorophyll a/b-binding protein [Elainellaceae cyanobacterium]